MPPTWYIDVIIKGYLRDGSRKSWTITKTSDKVECIPVEYIFVKRDEVVVPLQEGEIPYIDIRQFAETFSELYSLKDAELYFSTDSISQHSCVISQVAISNAWLEQHARGILDSVQTTGYADWKVSVSGLMCKCGSTDKLRTQYSDSSHRSAKVKS